MNQAIDQLLKKSARRHSCRKDKPEPCMEQGKCKEAIRKEAETLPPRNVSRESDDEQHSRASLETMDTDRCIQKLVRTEPKVLNALNVRLRKPSSTGWCKRKRQ